MAGRQIFDTGKIKQMQAPINSVFNSIIKGNKNIGGNSGILSFGKNVASSMEEAAKATGAFSNDAAALGEEALTSGTSLTSLGSIAEAVGISTGTVLAGGILAATAAMAASIPVAAQWQAQMGDIGYIIDDEGTKLGALSDKILNTSAALGISKETVLDVNQALLQMGYTPEQIKKTQENVAEYASISHQSGGEAASGIDKTSKAFGLTPEDTAKITSMYTGMTKNSIIPSANYKDR
jgi:hypothetical protein